MKKAFLSLLKSFFLLFLSLSLVQCAGSPPIYTYNQAHLALKKAEQAEGKKYAPKAINISKKYYKKAQKLYNERKYKKCEKELLKSIEWAERVENLSLLRKFKEEIKENKESGSE